MVDDEVKEFKNGSDGFRKQYLLLQKNLHHMNMLEGSLFLGKIGDRPILRRSKIRGRIYVGITSIDFLYHNDMHNYG